MTERSTDGRWLAGTSPNPGGRSSELAARQNEVRRRAAECSLEAVEYLYRVMRDDAESTAYRLQAANAILNRGCGLPQSNLDINVLLQRKLTELSTSDLLKL